MMLNLLNIFSSSLCVFVLEKKNYTLIFFFQFTNIKLTPFFHFPFYQYQTEEEKEKFIDGSKNS